MPIVWIVPDELRPAVTAAANRNGCSVDAWLTAVVLKALPGPDYADLETRTLAEAYGPNSVEAMLAKIGGCDG